METGIAKGFSVIANKLREKCGVSVELYRLYNPAEAGSIKFRGHGFNFAKIRDQVYTELATSIANDIDRLWAADWDIDAILLTGGGCRDLAQYLKPQITGNIIPVEANRDPRLNNVLGYIKYGQYVWGEAGDESTFAEAESESNPENTHPEEIESISEDELSEV
jgi:plasmid segregation protein ParM